MRAWQWACRDLLPAAFLAGLSVERHATYWRRWLSDAGLRCHLWLSTRDAHVVGFAATSPSRDAAADPGTGELLALYLEPEVVGTGVGRALCARAEEGLRHDGFHAATPWVLDLNAPARGFYERRGWRVDGGEKAEEFGDRTAREVRYRKAFTP